VRLLEARSRPLRDGRRLLQFLPFYFAEASIQRLPRAHQTRPRLDADELHAGSLVRVYQVTVVFVFDVRPDIIQDRFHDRQSILDPETRRLDTGRTVSAALFSLVCRNLARRDTLLDPRRRVSPYPLQRFVMSFEFIDRFDRAVRPFGFDLPQLAVP
jgi:hypothetical protein